MVLKDIQYMSAVLKGDKPGSYLTLAVQKQGGVNL